MYLPVEVSFVNDQSDHAIAVAVSPPPSPTPPFFFFFFALKGLAMIFAGQENLLIIFRSKEIYIHFKTNNKIP